MGDAFSGMGSAVGGILGGPLGLLGGGLLGSANTADALGMNGKSRINPKTANQGLDQLNASLNNADFKKALDPATGSAMATDQVQNNPILGQLFGKDGQMGKDLATQNDQTGRLNKLQDQGFQLSPEDRTMYGQASGDIARQFGQQGNQAAQSLAMRGLGAAPSGAAGATFSGLAGNQNEMLAKAQQGIMQQRFANTQNQIKQQQDFIGQMAKHNEGMGSQAASAINDQYGRNASGIKQQQGAMAGAADAQNAANSQDLQGQMAKEQTRNATFGEMLGSGIGSSAQNLGALPGKVASGAAGKLLGK